MFLMNERNIDLHSYILWHTYGVVSAIISCTYTRLDTSRNGLNLSTLNSPMSTPDVGEMTKPIETTSVSDRR
jgi:hypothetical protein